METTTYRWNASDYAVNSSSQFHWAEELIDKLDLAGTEHLLDIGCGDGKVTAFMADRLCKGRVVGIDNSRDMVSLAHRNFPPSCHKNLFFAGMSATQIAFRQCFDLVFSNAALHWTRNHPAVLAGVRQSLRPLGRLLFQMGGKGNARDVVNIVEEQTRRPKWCTYFDGFTFPYGFYGPTVYRSWLADAGLKAERVELIPKTMTHEGADGLAGWIRTTWLPYTQRIPEGLRAGFVEDIVESYVSVFPPDTENHIHVDMVRLEVEAVHPG